MIDTTPCGYCGGALPAPGGASYLRCPDCGSQNLRPLPNHEDNAYFDDESAVARMDAADLRRRGFLAARLRALHAAAGAERGLLLDIGCATGRVMQLAHDSGWRVAGVELSPALAGAAQRLHPDATILAGDAMNLDALPWGECRAIVALDVIEHVLDPCAFAGRLHRLLAPGGHVLLHTPNAAGLRARLHGERWNMQIPKYHFHLATPDGLHRLANRSGFTVVSFRTTSGTGQETGARRLMALAQRAILGTMGMGNGLETIWRKQPA